MDGTEQDISWHVREMGSTFELVATTQNDTSRIRARWRMHRGSLSTGPIEVSVLPARTKGTDIQRRGVTTGVMRAAEPLLVKVAAELPGQVQRFELATPLERLRDKVAQLGPSPRGNPFYYRHLLRLFAEIEKAGSAEPVRELADLLDLPRETVKTQLRVARSREHQGPERQPLRSQAMSDE